MTEDVNTNEKDEQSNDYDIRIRCNNIKNKDEHLTEDKEDDDFKSKLRWPDLTVQSFIHGGCIYGLYLALFHARIYTTLFGKLQVLYVKL